MTDATAARCRWFARCTNDAVSELPHPVLVSVPICQRCLDKLDRIEAARRA
jgi:hypothetical protein